MARHIIYNSEDVAVICNDKIMRSKLISRGTHTLTRRPGWEERQKVAQEMKTHYRQTYLKEVITLPPPAATSTIRINYASLKELLEIKGVGAKVAEKIEASRPYYDGAELLEVTPNLPVAALTNNDGAPIKVDYSFNEADFVNDE